MEIKTMATRLAVVCLLLGLSGPGCGSSPSGPLTADQFGAKYKFADNAVSGWTQSSVSDAFWAGTDLVGAGGLDGAAGAYQNDGFVQGMYQNLVGPDPEICTFWAMDFGTDANATLMFNDEKSNVTFVSIPGYDETVAVLHPTIIGGTAYAHFKASYFELQLSGFGNQTPTCTTTCGMAASMAAQFLAVLKSKTN